MAIDGCNVKELLKSLIFLQHKAAELPGTYNFGRNIINEKVLKQKETNAWNILLTALRSPYVVSPNSSIILSGDGGCSLDEEHKVYDELMRKTFYLKLRNRFHDGLEIENKAEVLISKGINHMLLKFLLCLSDLDEIKNKNENCFHLFESEQLRKFSQMDCNVSSWNSFYLDEKKQWNPSFFECGMATVKQIKSHDIFEETPGSHFFQSFSRQLPSKEDAVSKLKSSLFGALANQHSQRDLDMVLSLPEISDDTTISIFESKKSIDEGFVDESTSYSTVNDERSSFESQFTDELQIWSDCLRMDFQISHTWERLMRSVEAGSSKYLTESGPNAFDHYYKLRQNEAVYIANETRKLRMFPKEILISHVVNVLIGVPSEVFIFSKSRCSFTVNPLVITGGLSLEATQKLLNRFAEIGTYYRQLNRFTQHHSERLLGVSGGLTLESFISSLCSYLDYYKSAVLGFQEKFAINFLKIWAVFDDLGSQLRFLAEICLCSAAFSRAENAPRPKFPVGLRLLSYLFDLCNHQKSTGHYNVLIHLFKDTCVPFLRYISNWIFDGKCQDPYNEFLLDVDDQYLCYRDKHYWTHGYVLKENRKKVAMFDADLIEEIYACGKAINLLKEANKHHYLLRKDLHPPQIEVTLSASIFEKVKCSVEQYKRRVNNARIHELKEKELQISKLLQRRREKIADERRKHEETIQMMIEVERNIKKAIQTEKYKELGRLKKQMEDAIEKRKAEKETRLLEDRKFLKEELEAAAKKDENEKKAREELLRYYEELNKRAMARENRALWNIRRYELYQKRKNFILAEKVKLDEESMNSLETGLTKDDKHISLREEGSNKNKENSEDDSKVLIEGRMKTENDHAETIFMNNEKLVHERKEFAGDNEGVEKDSSEIKADDLPKSIPVSTNRVDAKSLIYNDSELVQGKLDVHTDKSLWEIERAISYQPVTVMKDLLYPGKSEMEAGNSIQSTRGVEPVVKIKDLLYHQEMAEKVFDLPARPWSQKELSLEVIVERYQDNYQEMNLTPQPILLDSVLNASHFIPNKNNDEADALKSLSLEIILHRSLIVPVAAQIKLVQNAAVEYIMDSLRIGLHFDAFRKYLLLEDGEFGLSLCNQIFEKAFEGMLTPKEFCKPSLLNKIINQALQFSIFADKLELSRQLSFSLQWMPDIFKMTDVNALDFLQLRYKVPWPCNIIITENCITKYNKVFSFLVRLKMVNWALQKVWYNLKRAGHSDKSGLSSQVRKLHLFRHEMQHFVNNVERYLVNQIIHISWQEFENDLENNVHNIDDLHKFHVNYLNRIISRSLLNKNASAVLKIILDIFTFILKFYHQILSADWKECDNGNIEHPFFNSLCSLYNGFKQYAQFLFKVVSKLIQRGYQNHLDHFLLQFNFNGCYE